MIVNRQHEDFDEPPNIPIITGGIKRPKKNNDAISEVLCNAVVAITQALTTSKSNPSTSQKASSIIISPSSKATLKTTFHS